MPERITMTEARVKALQPPATGRRMVYDEDVKTLALRVTSANERTWYLSAWHDGKQRWISLGKWPDISVAMARELAQEAVVKLRRGIDPMEEKRALAAKAKEQKAGGKVPLKDALRLHLDNLERKNRDPGHLREIERVAQAAMAAGVIDLADPSVASKARIWLDGLDLSEPTRNRYRVHLCALSKVALKHWPAEVLPRDPFLALTGQGVALPPPPVFNPAEAVHLVSDQALALPGGQVWAFLLLTGCRFKEATWARWDRIDLDRATFDVVPPDAEEYAAGARVKRMKPRTVHLGIELIALLRTWQANATSSGPFLFSDEWRRRSHALNTKAFRAHLAALGIPLDKRKIHSLRHTRQTLGIACGEDSLRLRLAMGHAGEDMSAHYGRLAMRWRGLLSTWKGELALRNPHESQRVLSVFTATAPVINPRPAQAM